MLDFLHLRLHKRKVFVCSMVSTGALMANESGGRSRGSQKRSGQVKLCSYGMFLVLHLHGSGVSL